MRANSQKIPSNKKVVERGLSTSSSSLKRKMTQREKKIARNVLSVCPLSSNSRRDSCSVHDEDEVDRMEKVVFVLIYTGKKVKDQ